MTLNDQEKRELDAWIYNTIPGLKTCDCVHGVMSKFGPTEYAKIRKLFLEQGSKDRWPKIEPDLPCDHAPHFTDSPAALEVLKRCATAVEPYEIHIGNHRYKDGEDFKWMVCTNDHRGQQTISETLELAICLFAKKLFEKGAPTA